MESPSDNKIALDRMEKMGWDFLPYGPNDWEWMKFDGNKLRIARQGDAIWQADLEAAYRDQQKT